MQLGDSVSCQVGTLIEAFLAYWPSRSYLAEKTNIEYDDNDETVSAQIKENNEQVLFQGVTSLYENMVALEGIRIFANSFKMEQVSVDKIEIT